MSSNTERTAIPGITLRSIVASILCMLLMGMHLQIVEVMLDDGSAFAEQSLPIPAMSVFMVVSLLTAALALATRFRVLTRHEMFCVLFTMLIACPMMTQGMWHRFVGIIAATPKFSHFDYIDAFNDNLWPHGKNLVPSALTGPDREQLVKKGNPPAWNEVEYEEGSQATAPTLANTNPDETSSVGVRIPLEKGGKPYLIPGEPYLVSFLVRPKDLGPESFYFCRIYYDEDPNYTEIINSREPEKITFLHKKGFLRVGNYEVRFLSSAKEFVTLDLGLSGTGAIEVLDPKVFSVAALVDVYKGKRVIPRKEFDALPIGERAGLVPKPENMFSLAGLRFLIAAHVPLRDWVTPAMVWATLILILLTALLCINVVMRKQWAESERYPFPLFQIPNALLGNVDEPERGPLAPIWTNRYMWVGLGLSLFWGLMRGWNFYNHNVPDLNVAVPLQPYFNDPGWGGMWNITFAISSVLVSICIFFELNVLLSLVLGFFLFRALMWFGQWRGLTVYQGYPFRYEQAIGAYFAYAFVVLFFTRKYLWQALKSAATGKQKDAASEVFSYRVAIVTLFLCFVGIYLWAQWLNVSRLGILAYFFFLVTIGFVASKFRAECGLPVGYFTPYNAMLFVSLLGGMTAFGASGMMVCLLASGFLTVSVFFFIPGAQLELMEFGRRMNLKRRHVLYTCLLGGLGGLFIGGWVFLSVAYSAGGDNIKYQWSFNQDWFLSSYRSELQTRTIEYKKTVSQSASATAPAAKDQDSAAKAKGSVRVKPATYAYVFGAVGTLILTVIRQFYAGFWFHPVGFILGSAHMLEWGWGSCLVALIIRSVVLWLGGAHTVKTKLLPFFVGVFMGSVLTCLAFNTYGFILKAQGIERIYGALP